MKAMIYREYGDPSVLHMEEVDRPVPLKNEVLVKVHTSSINDFDWGLLRGIPFVNKLISGLKGPKYTILGTDIAGVVEAVGTEVTRFKPGDHVMGDISESGWGGFAQFTAVKEDALCLKPEEMDFTIAACLPHSGILALKGLIYDGRLKKNQRILINGAGGGAGTVAIQIARNLGAHVTAVDSREKQELMKEMGAHEVMDYGQTDFTSTGDKYHLILDNHICHPLKKMRKMLQRGGRYLMVGGESKYILQMFLWSRWHSLLSPGKLKILFHKPNFHLDKLIEMVQQNLVTPQIDKVFSLDDLPRAMEYYGQARARGKIIIKVQ